MNIITKKELLIISTILSIVVFSHLLLFLSSNQYICLNEVLQALLSMEFYVNKSQVEFELYTSKSSIDVYLFGKDQKMFYINESLISTEFNVMDDPINPMYKKVLYIVAGIIIVGGICYLGYPFFPPLSPDLSPSVTFLDKVDVLLYNSLDSTNILLSSPSYYTHLIEHNLALYDLSTLPPGPKFFSDLTVANLASSTSITSPFWWYLPVQ